MARILIAGFDEVGRGCLAGPIIAVGALFHMEPEAYDLASSPIPGLKDSKAFSNPESRKLIFQELIKSAHLVEFGVGCVGSEVIDKEGIDEANAVVFHEALENLAKEPDYLLVDGLNPVRHFQKAFQYVAPQADGLYWPVSAASILAKVIRDELMTELSYEYPVYGWDNNAGYGTEQHRDALKKYGPCPLHRKKFIRKILGR